MSNDPIQLPDGTKVERLYECADCGHISDSHDSRFDGPRTQSICENCGEPSLMLHPGDPIQSK